MKTIGIIGGMGPMATADLFEKIIRFTPAQTDQEHIPVLIYSNPQIPDRTEAILRGGESPVPHIVAVGNQLVDMGADFLLLPCNTSFYFFDEIQAGIRAPLVNMVDVTVEELSRRGHRKVCILATEGTTKAGTYRAACERANIETIPLEDEMVHMVHDLIYKGVKAGAKHVDTSAFQKKLQALQAEGAEVFVLACTELPILFAQEKLAFPTLDPSEWVAKRAVELARQST